MKLKAYEKLEKIMAKQKTYLRANHLRFEFTWDVWNYRTYSIKWPTWWSKMQNLWWFMFYNRQNVLTLQWNSNFDNWTLPYEFQFERLKNYVMSYLVEWWMYIYERKNDDWNMIWYIFNDKKEYNDFINKHDWNKMEKEEMEKIIKTLKQYLPKYNIISEWDTIVFNDIWEDEHLFIKKVWSIIKTYNLNVENISFIMK